MWRIFGSACFKHFKHFKHSKSADVFSSWNRKTYPKETCPCISLSGECCSGLSTLEVWHDWIYLWITSVFVQVLPVSCSQGISEPTTSVWAHWLWLHIQEACTRGQIDLGSCPSAHEELSSLPLRSSAGRVWQRPRARRTSLSPSIGRLADLAAKRRREYVRKARRHQTHRPMDVLLSVSSLLPRFIGLAIWFDCFAYPDVPMWNM